MPPTHRAAGLVVQAPGTKGLAPLCPPGGPTVGATASASIGATLVTGFVDRVARVPGHDSSPPQKAIPKAIMRNVRPAINIYTPLMRCVKIAFDSFVDASNPSLLTAGVVNGVKPSAKRHRLCNEVIVRII